MRTVDVRDLLEQPGARLALRLDEPFGKLAVGLAEVDTPVTGDLDVEGTSDGIVVSGKLSGGAEFTCARCLKSYEAGFEVVVSEVFAEEPGDDEYGMDDPASVDLEPLVRDAVLLAMPFSPLCRTDCKGLCPSCGADRNLGECRCPETEIDPRWAPFGTANENDQHD